MICVDVAHASGRHECVLSGLCSLPSTIIPRGTILFREGEPSHGVYVLRSGRVLLSVATPGTHSRVIHIARAGEILGLATLFTEGAYDATAEVARPAQFSFVPHEEVRTRLSLHPDARLEILRQLSHDVISCHDWVRSARVGPDRTSCAGRGSGRPEGAPTPSWPRAPAPESSAGGRGARRSRRTRRSRSRRPSGRSPALPRPAG